MHDPSVSPTDRLRANTALQSGNLLLRADPVRAFAFYKKAVETDPWYAESWHALGVSCLLLGDGECADESGDAAVENEAVIHRLPPTFRAKLIMQLHQQHIAWLDLAPTLALSPSQRTPDPALFLDFVHPTWKAHRRIAEALLPEILQRVAERPSGPEMWARLDAYQARLAADPRIAESEKSVTGGIGWFYLLFGNNSEAVRFLEYGVRRTPNKAHYRLFLAMAYQRAGRTPEARTQAQEAFRLEPQTLDRIFGDYPSFEREWLSPPPK